MYSQNNEEVFILDYFKSKPLSKFLEIGSFHPFKFSNTRALVELGWHGVYCEPSPKCFQSFIDEYKDNEKIKLLNYAIGKESGIAKFFDSQGDAVSTTIESECNKWGKDRFKQIEVQMMSMQHLIENLARMSNF